MPKKSRKYEVEFASREQSRFIPVLFYVYAVLIFPYLVWRLSVINWDIWYGPLIYLADLYGAITTALFLWLARRIDVPVHRPIRRKLRVDALIPTYNEPLEIVEATVRGALEVRGIGQVFLLDDGNRPEMRAMAKRLGVRYYARTTNEHAKAGNMNNGLKYSKAQYILSLDADHVPVPEFLERVLGYFDDKQLAFVQTPQTYYNTDSFLFRRSRKGLWSEQIMFYNCIQPAKNRFNSAFFVGTSALLRRKAIDDVGGFATGTATEDIHTSLRLHAKGWKSVFLPEALAYGLESSSLKEFYKQRRRWSAGSLGLLFRSPDSPLWARGLTWPQRLNYLSATLAHLQGVQKLLYLIVSALTAFTLIAPINANIAHFNLIFIFYLTMGISFTTVYARGTYHLLHTEAYGLANMMAHLAGLKGVFRVQRKFAVSHKLTRRREKTILKPVFYGLFLLSILAIGRATYLLVSGTQWEGLLASSLGFTGLQLVFLVSFLGYLLLYERRAVEDVQPDQAIAAYRQRLELTISESPMTKQAMATVE